MRRLYISLAALPLLLVIGAFALRSPAAVLGLTQWAVATFTELRLELKNPVINLYGGEMRADELHLIPKDTQGPPLFSVIGLDVATTLHDIVSGRLRNTSLSATQLSIYVSENNETSNPEPQTWLQLADWLPEKLAIGQVHLITAAENTWIFPLKDVMGARLEEEHFQASALADYDGEPLQATLDILAFSSEERIERLELRSSFHAVASDSKVTLEGVVSGGATAFTYDFSALASYRDISEFLKGVNSDIVLQGSLEIAARLHGDSKGFTLSDASMTLDNMPSYGFEAAGELHYTLSGENQIELIAAGEMDSLKYLVNWLDMDIAELGRAQASVNLSGSLEDPRIEDFILITQSEQGLGVNISGKLESLHEGSAVASDNEIRVDAHGPSLEVMAPWLGQIPYDPGPWRASWITRGSTETISLSNILLEMGSKNALSLRVEGAISEIANTASVGLNSIKGLDLNVSAFTPDSQHLPPIEKLAIPPHHEISARLALRGSGSDIQVTSGEITANTPDMTASISDIRAQYTPGTEERTLQAASAHVDITLSDTSVLSQYVEREIPVLGAVHMVASLRQQGNLAGLSDIALAIDGDDFHLQSRGSVRDIANGSGVRLKNTLEGVDIRHSLTALMSDFQFPRTLGYLNASFTIADEKEQWQVRGLKFHTTPPGGPIEASGDGNIDDLTGLTTADLDAHISIRDQDLLEALTGLRIAATDATLAIETTPQDIDLSLRTLTGKTDLSAEFTVGYRDSRVTGVEAQINTSQLYLADLGLQAQSGEDYAPAELIDSEPKTLLEKLLEQAPEYPVDVQVQIDGVTGENTNIDSLNMHVTGSDRRYTLRQFSIVYDDALAEIRGIIDLNASPPFVSLAGEVLAIPLFTLSRDMGAPSDITGTMTARGGISSTGRDTAALLASLDGSVAVALENTVIRGAAYDVLATDLLAWIYSGAALEKSTHLDCTMARFQLEDGVATTDSIYIETARMLATGKGVFDLPRQKMDLTIVPLSRSRSFQIPSEVRLRGDMSNPRPTISPISAAADASAQALLLIPKIAMRLFGQGGQASDKGIQPCQATLAN